MKKILLAIDAINPDKNALDFACFIARLTHSKLTGVFLENLVSEERVMTGEIYAENQTSWRTDALSDENNVKREIIETNITYFKEACVKREVSYSLHRDRNVPLYELVEESRFADLIVIDAKTSFSKHYEGRPTTFVKEFLKNAECPVIISPENFDAIDEIIFSYDGSPSSVFAIKQFTYLFPQLNNNKTTIIHINEKGEWFDNSKYKFKEWLKTHYSDLHFEILKGNIDQKLFERVVERKNIILVMGSYGRNILSLFFTKSHAELLIKAISPPIFITHV